jgi:hypothetical protein
MELQNVWMIIIENIPGIIVNLWGLNYQRKTDWRFPIL